MKKPDKLLLCYVTDRRSLRLKGRQTCDAALLERIANASRAGIDWVQIREKDLPGRELVDLTREAIRRCQSAAGNTKTRILVNDRLDVAWAAGAGGVHAGEKSLPMRVLVDERRSASLANFLVGASCHSVEAAVEAANAGADYVFFGPVFETPSKARFGSPQGLPKLAEVCAAVSIPVIAIGGITLENAGVCRASGAAGIAAIRLFQDARDIGEIVANLTAN